MTVRIEKDGPVWTVVHSRPEVRNAMDPESARALHDAFLEFNADDGASVAVFWGEGGAFCAGWDLKVTAALGDRVSMSRYDVPDRAEGDGGEPGEQLPMAAMGPSRLDLDKPVIAAVSGPAVAGGMELAMWCDVRVMEETAYMGVYCRRWGVPLIDGGTVRLPRLVGQGRAMDLILTGRQVMAEECERIGLCEYVVPEGQARDRAEALAAEIAAFPQLCVRADRRSAIDQQGMSERDGLINEWRTSRDIVAAEGVAGATRFAEGAGRHGTCG
ncbi:MAG: crotonase/enoyl-CoA hydratase family protein [Actinomycetota bacterium]